MLVASGLEASSPGSREHFVRVMIDPGHGGEDRGARGSGGLVEKDLVLDVSKRLARLLEKQGLEALLTRTDDQFVSLEKRSAVANEAGADLFVSIHANAAATPAPRGVETFFLSLEASDEASSRLAARENASFRAARPLKRGKDPLDSLLRDMSSNESMRESDRFAKLADRELSRLGPAPSRGVKQAPFRVLMGTQMPSVLVEIGFMSNPTEESALRDARRREAIATALARAVVAFGKQHNARRGRTAALRPDEGRAALKGERP